MIKRHKSRDETVAQHDQGVPVAIQEAMDVHVHDGSGSYLGCHHVEGVANETGVI